MTAQCIFEGKTYKEGDKWNVGCNDIMCYNGKPYTTARKLYPYGYRCLYLSISSGCPTINGTCVPLNADNYPCKIDNDQYSSCMCLQDNFGYGENNVVKGKIAGESKLKTRCCNITLLLEPAINEGGGLVTFCVDNNTGTKYELGKTWERNCFTLRCTKNEVTEIVDKSNFSLLNVITFHWLVIRFGRGAA